MAISKFENVFDTWAYPRVYFFERRFKDVHKRFTNVIDNGAYPIVFKPKSEVVDRTHHLKDMLEKPLGVYVIGKNNIDKDDLVITSEEPRPSDSVKKSVWGKKIRKAAVKGHGFTVVLLHISIKDIDEKGLKKVLDIVKEFTSKHLKKMTVSPDSILILCQPKTTCDQSKLDSFQQRVQNDVKEKFQLELQLGQILFSKEKQTLSTKISDILEAKVIDGLCTMKAHLEGFVKGVSNILMEKVDVVESDKLINALQGFLKNGMGFVDILADSRSKSLKFEDVLLKNIVRVIRCAILEPLSMKFDLTQDVCNQVAFELMLDEKMKENISRNTRYHLSKVEKHSCDLEEAIKQGNKWYSFPSRDFLFVAYPLRDDIKSAVLNFEKHLAALQKNVIVMKKMIFEIKGNIKLSPFVQEDFSIPECKTEGSEELRKDLFAIEGVYGIGRIFGEWEIHVENEAAEQSVKDLIIDYRIRHPIRIRRVIKKATPLAGGQVEHGIALETQSPKDPNKYQSGTLGMFADGPNNDVYALTCGHVVNVSDGKDHEVYIPDGTGKRTSLGTSSRNRTVLTGSLQSTPLVDLAAVKVFDSVVPMCTKYLKNDDGMLKNPVLSSESNADLERKTVFKYGAATDLTTGVICSNDYDIGHMSNEYIILIAPSPDLDSNIVEYAQRGDSGSLICMSDIDKNKTVKVVSMLNAGELKLHGQKEDFSFSFRMKTGLEELRNTPSGIQLNVPSEESGLQMF